MHRRICHLLIAFGKENQSYTTNLLEDINKYSDDEHFVFCHSQLIESTSITIFDSHQQSKLQSIFKYAGLYFKDSGFRQIAKRFTRREKYKWIQLFQLDFDVVHIHHSHAISYDILHYLSQRKTKIILSLRGRDLLVNTRGEKRFHELKQKLELADEIHCISEFMQKKLHQLFGLDSKLIYRGQPGPKKENVKNSFGNRSDIKLIAVGRLVWEKGHIYILESIAKLKERGIQVTADIYGSGDLEDFLVFRIKQLEIEDEVNLKGYVDNDMLKKLYRSYDVAVQPSISEALSNGLIDLMLHNLPCVITDVGGMPEIIKNNKNGIVIPPMKMASLDEAIIQATKLDGSEINAYNNKIKKKFSVQTEISSYIKLYKDVLSS